MRRIIGVLFSFMMIFALPTCGNRVEQEDSEENSTVETTQSTGNNTIGRRTRYYDAGNKNIGSIFFVYGNYGTCSGVCGRDFRSRSL